MNTRLEKNKIKYLFRKLKEIDEKLLSDFFLSLSKETKSQFAPHPLTTEYAAELCQRRNDTADRFVLLTESQDIIFGYFILEYEMSSHEKSRYEEQGAQLLPKLDVLFAPVIADEYQNKGLASLVMPLLIQSAKDNRARSLVLMGGTQETNPRAIAFYEKFGFKKYGGYQTDIFNYDMRVML